MTSQARAGHFILVALTATVTPSPRAYSAWCGSSEPAVCGAYGTTARLVDVERRRSTGECVADGRLDAHQPGWATGRGGAVQKRHALGSALGDRPEEVMRDLYAPHTVRRGQDSCRARSCLERHRGGIRSSLLTLTWVSITSSTL